MNASRDCFSSERRFGTETGDLNGCFLAFFFLKTYDFR